MTSTVQASLRAFALAAACVSALNPGNLRAGEPIVIGNGKTRIEPGKETKPDVGLFGKSIGKVDNNPFQGIAPTPLPPPSNPRQDRRLQNRIDEKRNWILLKEGELTGNDQSFGVNDRAYSAEGLEKENTSRDYTFYNLTKKGQNSGQPTPELLRQIQKVRQSRELDSAFEKTEKSSSPGTISDTSQLDFRKLFQPEKSEKNFLGQEKMDFSMQNLFNTPEPSSFETKAQENHTARFNEFLNGPAPANSFDSFRQQALDNRVTATPALDFAPKAAAAPASNPLFSTPSAVGGLPSISTPGADPNFGRANPFSAAPAAPTPREPAKKFTPPQDFPRRSF